MEMTTLVDRALVITVPGFQEWFRVRLEATRLPTNYEKYKVGELMRMLDVVPNAYGYWESQAQKARESLCPEKILDLPACPATYPVPNPILEAFRGGQVQRMYTPEEFMSVCQWYYQWKEVPTQGVGPKKGG